MSLMGSSLRSWTTWLRKSWARVLLKDVIARERRLSFSLLYCMRDPWNMRSGKQQFRFRETSRMIAERFGCVGTLLEVGCGEGHQSEFLRQNCEQLFGVDISELAVQRARERCPQGRFATGDIFTQECFPDQVTFDLVVACEVLYYLPDIAGKIERLRALGRCGLVTYYREIAGRIELDLSQLPHLGQSVIRHEDSGSEWLVLTWSDEDGPVERPASLTGDGRG